MKYSDLSVIRKSTEQPERETISALVDTTETRREKAKLASQTGRRQATTAHNNPAQVASFQETEEHEAINSPFNLHREALFR